MHRWTITAIGTRNLGVPFNRLSHRHNRKDQERWPLTILIYLPTHSSPDHHQRKMVFLGVELVARTVVTCEGSRVARSPVLAQTPGATERMFFQPTAFPNWGLPYTASDSSIYSNPSFYPIGRQLNGSPKRKKGLRRKPEPRKGSKSKRVTSSSSYAHHPLFSQSQSQSKKPCPYKLKAELAEHLQWQLEQQHMMQTLQSRYSSPARSQSHAHPPHPPPTPSPTPAPPTTTPPPTTTTPTPTPSTSAPQTLQQILFSQDPMAFQQQQYPLLIDSNGMVLQQMSPPSSPQQHHALFSTDNELLSKFESTGLLGPSGGLVQLRQAFQAPPEQQVMQSGEHTFGNQLQLLNAQLSSSKQHQQQQPQQLILLNSPVEQLRQQQQQSLSVGRYPQMRESAGALLLPNGQIIVNPLNHQQPPQHQQQQSIVLLQSPPEPQFQEYPSYPSSSIANHNAGYTLLAGGGGLEDSLPQPLPLSPPAILQSRNSGGSLSRNRVKAPTTIYLSSPHSAQETEREEEAAALLSLASREKAKRRRRLHSQQQQQQYHQESMASSEQNGGSNKRYVLINKEDLKQLKKKSQRNRLRGKKQQHLSTSSSGGSSVEEQEDRGNLPPPPEVVHIKYHPSPSSSTSGSESGGGGVAVVEGVSGKQQDISSEVGGGGATEGSLVVSGNSGEGGSHKTLTFDSYIASVASGEEAAQGDEDEERDAEDEYAQGREDEDDDAEDDDE